MSRKIQFHTFHLLFRLFSYLADKSGGWSLFVRPKLMVGALIVAMGVTAPKMVIAQDSPNHQNKNNETQLSAKDSSQTIKENDSEPLCYTGGES